MMSVLVARGTARRRAIAYWLGQRSRRDPGVTAGFCIVLGVVLLSILAQWLPYDPEEASGRNVLASPSLAHPFGTDSSGRDVLTRALYAPRVDLVIAVAATGVSILAGAPLGLIAGLLKGTSRLRAMTSSAILRLADVTQAFPVFVLALAIATAVGPSILTLVAAIAFVNAPLYLRLTYAEVLAIREMPYVEAARATGLSERSLAVRHVLPNAIAPTLVTASATIGWAVLLTAGLSFIGAGIRPPTPEWGSMIALGAQNVITGQWWTALFPGLLLAATVVGFSLMGQGLERVMQAGAQPSGTTRPQADEDHEEER